MNKGNTMLLRGKYDALINVMWDCFDQSNFYISRINIIKWNNIHLLHAGEGNMKIYSPKSIVKSKVNIHWGGFAFIKKVSKGWTKVYNGADGFILITCIFTCN